MSQRLATQNLISTWDNKFVVNRILVFASSNGELQWNELQLIKFSSQADDLHVSAWEAVYLRLSAATCSKV